MTDSLPYRSNTTLERATIKEVVLALAYPPQPETLRLCVKTDSRKLQLACADNGEISGGGLVNGSSYLSFGTRVSLTFDHSVEKVLGVTANYTVTEEGQ